MREGIWRVRSRSFFDSWKGKIAGVEKASAAHIIVRVNQERSEAEARTIIERAEAELEGGASFTKVAERYSDCKGIGGDLGEFERGKMVEEFDRAVFALKPGQRSAIFRTPFGFHIAELRSIEKGGVREPGALAAGTRSLPHRQAPAGGHGERPGKAARSG